MCAVEAVVIKPGCQAKVPLGIAVRPPAGTYARLAPRSGLALRNGIHVGGGVIDRDYVGECAAILFNHGHEDFAVAVGGRVAQIIFEKIAHVAFETKSSLEAETSRGSKGCGSSGASSQPKFALEPIFKPDTEGCFRVGGESDPEPKEVAEALDSGSTAVPSAVGTAGKSDAVIAAAAPGKALLGSQNEAAAAIAQPTVGTTGKTEADLATATSGKVKIPVPGKTFPGSNNEAAAAIAASGGESLKYEPLRHASQENAEANGRRSWMRPGFHDKLTAGQEKWMKKHQAGDLSGYETPAETFVALRGEK